MNKITFRCPTKLSEEVERKLRSSDYPNKSELLRDLLRRWVKGEILEVVQDDAVRKR